MKSAVASRLLSELTPTEALSVARLLNSIWPRRGVEGRVEQLRSLGEAYDGPAEQAPRSLLVLDGDKTIAHALVFRRRIALAGEDTPILALAMVGSDPEYRGQGLGALVARAAFDLVDAGAFPFCLFQTSFPVQSFYERLGACRVENRVVNSLAEEDPGANPFWDDLVMRYPAARDWPDGVIDLRGPGY